MTTTQNDPIPMTTAQLVATAGGIILNNDGGGRMAYYQAGQDPVQREPWRHGFSSPEPDLDPGPIVGPGQNERPIWQPSR